MLPFYRRYVTGWLQKSEFLVNGGERANVHFNEKFRGGKFRAEKAGCRESRCVSGSVIAEPRAYSSLLRKRWRAGCARRARDSDHGRRSVADRTFRLACLRAGRPCAA